LTPVNGLLPPYGLPVDVVPNPLDVSLAEAPPYELSSADALPP
jgi:hypothetical protein